MKADSYAYDNQRFFTSRHQSGLESGSEGWLKITVKGHRDFLSGIDPERSALVVVDMQDGCVDAWPDAIARYDVELAEIYRHRMTDIVIPNIARLLDFFREKGLLIVYLTLRDGNVVPELAPDGEVVVRKYSAGAFATSALDNLLRENGIATIFAVGTDTCGCVDATITEAYDRSYQTILIEDGCCSSRPELHDATVKIWAYKGFVRTTDQVVDDYPWQGWVDPGMRDPTGPASVSPS